MPQMLVDRYTHTRTHMCVCLWICVFVCMFLHTRTLCSDAAATNTSVRQDWSSHADVLDVLTRTRAQVEERMPHDVGRGEEKTEASESLTRLLDQVRACSRCEACLCDVERRGGCMLWIIDVEHAWYGYRMCMSMRA